MKVTLRESLPYNHYRHVFIVDFKGYLIVRILIAATEGALPCKNCVLYAQCVDLGYLVFPQWQLASSRLV